MLKLGHMITVPEATEVIVNRSRYLSEALSKDLINLSSLARYIRPELEDMLKKDISTSAIIMALKRLRGKLTPQTPYANIFKSEPEITARTGLSLILLNTHSVDTPQLNEAIYEETKKNSYVTVTRSLSEVLILAGKHTVQAWKNQFKTAIKNVYPNVAAITLILPTEAMTTPGVYYFFLKSLAWERINIVEMVSTPSELTLIVSEKDLNRTLAIIKSLFSET